MRGYKRLIAMSVCVVSTGLLLPGRVRADVVGTKAHVETTVNEVSGGSVLQTDKANLDFPGTASTTPVIVRAKLSRNDPAGQFISGARGLVLYDDGHNGQLGQPNNVGLDIAAFSTSKQSGWSVDGLATETRTLVVTSKEAQSLTGVVKVANTLFFSGVLFLTSQDAAQDLTGAQSTVEFRVTRTGSDGITDELQAGSAALVGDGVGSVSAQLSGAVNSLHVVVPLDGAVAGFPVLRAMFFIGALPVDQYPFTYSTKIGEQYDLALSIHSTVKVPPGQIGAVAVFGTPQEGFADLYQKAKNSDAGAQVQDVISQHVDTTGANQPASDSVVTPAAPLACGTVGFEALGLAGMTLLAAVVGGIRRRRRMGW